ncbi:DUF2726 domain-containing protein [Enterobacteriaceae bacterium YMB-R22]|jgi:hypothetical protein|uniref:DUF2726 domain-containing protein n=1 Tax=Tenebrionicola larvae TaxID=2815733 RepID=UPI0020117D57|nr:DUF2726 domain-containing protein [Tenebrionicola larvae]MBV4414457.1 DUF2726 domain-containing protein [Tenebrionicola larvae]
MDIQSVIILLLLAVIFFLYKSRNKKRASSPPPQTFQRPRSVSNVGDQLYFVENGVFKKHKLMNKEEFYLFRKIELFLQKNYSGYRVFPQVAMGVYLRSDDAQAHSSVNSKRADFVIISKFGEPCVVVEYHGGGHYKANAASRDAVKKEACRKAGIRYMEIEANYKDDDINAIGRYLAQAAAA